MAEDLILKVSLDGAEKETEKLVKLQLEIDRLAANKKALNKQEKDLAKAVKDGNISRTEYTSKLKEVKAQQIENGTALKANNAVLRENQRQITNTVKSQQLAKGSLVQLQAQLRKDTFEYDRLSKANRQYTKEGIALKKSVDAQSAALKKLEGETGRNQRNVGNYGDALNGVLPIMGGFGTQIMTLQRTMGALQGALGKVAMANKANAAATEANTLASQANTLSTEANTVAEAASTAATTANTTAEEASTVATTANTAATTEQTAVQKASAAATGGMTKALKFLKVALAATGIGLIVVALGSMVAALASTQRGMDALNRVLEPIKETFQTIFGIIQDVGLSVFDSLRNAINNPIQTLKNLGTALKENFINRLKGAGDFVKSYAGTIISGFKLMGLGIKKALASVPILGAGIDQEQLKKDLDQAKAEAIKSAKDLAGASIQITTGLTKEQQKQAVELTKTYTAEGKKRLAEAKARGLQIANLEREIEESAIGLRFAVEGANREFENQKEIAQNVLKTDKERIEAVKEAKRQLSIVSETQQAQVKKEIELLKLRAKANDTDNEAKKEIRDKEADLLALQAAEKKKGILLSNTENTIIKQRIALNKKASENAQKELDKITKATEEASKNEQLREEQKEKEILDNKIKQLELEAKLEELAIEDKLKKEQGLEEVTAEQIAEEKFNIAIELERKLADLRIKQNEQQANTLIKKEKELADKIKALKEKSNNEETVEIIKAQDELAATTQEREKVQGEQLTQIKLENKVKEEEKLSEEDDRLAEIAKEKKAKKDEEEAEELKAKEEQQLAIKNAAVEAGEKFVQEAFNNQNRRIDEGVQREVDALNLKREAGEISEEEFNKKRLEIDKKAFSDRKRLSQAQNAIDFAVAAGKTLAQVGFVAGAPLLIPLGIQAAAQAAIIASQKFAQGGVIHGASHANGGVNIAVGNSGMIEAEGGEAIINKKSTAKHLNLLSAINQDGGGVAFGSPNVGSIGKFANGGITPSVSVQNENIDLNDLETRIAQAVGSLTVKNVASETTGVANRVQQIEDSASF